MSHDLGRPLSHAFGARRLLCDSSSADKITVFKSLTNLIIVTGDYFWHEQPVSPLIGLSLLFMTCGALFAAKNDLHFE